MTAIQCLFLSIAHIFGEFLPLGGGDGLTSLTAQVLSLPEPGKAFAVAVHFGAFLSLFIYFRHDLASVVSCFLQILIYRKRPMTLDEKLPLFLLLALLPQAVLLHYLPKINLPMLQFSFVSFGIALGVFGIFLALADYFSRKSKGIFDWNGLDSFLVGLLQCLTVIPGVGQLGSVLLGSRLRNYRRDAAAKFGFYCLIPVFFFKWLQSLRDAEFHPLVIDPSISWISFLLCLGITTVAGLLAIGSFMKHVQEKTLLSYTVYRLLLVAGAAGVMYGFNR